MEKLNVVASFTIEDPDAPVGGRKLAASVKKALKSTWDATILEDCGLVGTGVKVKKLKITVESA